MLISSDNNKTDMYTLDSDTLFLKVNFSKTKTKGENYG